jgi:hypothetical protein
MSVLFALGCVNCRVSQAWLESVTGYTDKPISRALRFLQEIQLVDQTSAGYGLAAGEQLPLMFNGSLQLESDGGRNNSDSIIINKESLINREDLNNNNTGTRNKSDSGLDQDLVQALQAAGIYGAVQLELAQQAWLTVDLVQAWEAELIRIKGSNYTPGLLVYTLRQGPLDLPDNHSTRTRHRKNYTEGEYADFIEH